MILEFTDSPFIRELRFTQSRESGNRFIRLVIVEATKETRLLLKNPHPLEDVFDIVEATRIWIEDEGATQKDYGRFKVGYSDESHNAFWVDFIERELVDRAQNDSPGAAGPK